MRKLIYFILLILTVSCSELINRPKNLLPENKMSEIIAEFAVNDQLNTYLPATNMESATRFVLKKHKTNATAFNESYKYYLATGDLEEILVKAQEVIMERDPKAEDYINKKLQQNQNTPAFAR